MTSACAAREPARITNIAAKTRGSARCMGFLLSVGATGGTELIQVKQFVRIFQTRMDWLVADLLSYLPRLLLDSFLKITQSPTRSIVITSTRLRKHTSFEAERAFVENCLLGKEFVC